MAPKKPRDAGTTTVWSPGFSLALAGRAAALSSGLKIYPSHPVCEHAVA